MVSSCARVVSLSLVGLLAACEAPTSDETAALSQQRSDIIHGKVTPAGAYPNVGSIVVQYQGQVMSSCTGTLIAPNAVLTAAHCVHPAFVGNIPLGFTFIRDVSTATAADVYRASSRHVHPDFRLSDPGAGLAKWNDIAVLMLEKPVPNVVPALIPPTEEANKLLAGSKVEIVGYGLIDGRGEANGVKYHAESTLVEIAPYEIWVARPGEAQQCKGDSGGPTFAKVPGRNELRIIGVTSRAEPGGEYCDKGGISTRVDGFLSWIEARVTLPCGSGSSPACEDTDGDGTDDPRDNCPQLANPGQADADLDGIGDACEPDSDQDGVLDDLDNCAAGVNPGQEDVDGDGLGNFCDDDADADGALNAADNCPLLANVGQEDADGDGVGDVCDATPAGEVTPEAPAVPGAPGEKRKVVADEGGGCSTAGGGGFGLGVPGALLALLSLARRRDRTAAR